MQSKNIVKEFEINGEKFIFRHLSLKDHKQLHKYVNGLVKEGSSVLGKKVTLEQELGYTYSLIKRVKIKASVAIVAESNGEILGMAHIDKKVDAEGHVGTLAIGLKKEARGMGLGTKLIDSIIAQAKTKLKIELIELEGFSENKAAVGLYKKMGFVIVGNVKKGLKRNGKYFDRIMMVKYLK
jgi:RimJ/RimL family protein N-acetyltransferase